MVTKKTIILIHGFRGTHHGLALIAHNLSDYHVIIPDLPGFAHGDTLDDYSLDSYVTWMKNFIKKQKLTEPPVLLGHSFGSIITAAYAAKFPHTIESLILVNPIGAPALEGPRAVLSKLATFYYWVGKQLPHAFAKRWLASNAIVMVMSVTMAKTKDKTLRAFIHNQHKKYFSLFHTPTSLAESFDTSIHHNVREVAAMIHVPTLLIAGELDDITPLEKQKELVTLFPNAQLVVIDNVGHLTHYETPDQVATIIYDFIRSK